MDDLVSLSKSKELRKASHRAAKRWLDASWNPVTIEEYVDFLDDIQGIKKSLNALELPHPKMKGEKFSI